MQALARDMNLSAKLAAAMPASASIDGTTKQSR
jgi:hypothetical protein